MLNALRTGYLLTHKTSIHACDQGTSQKHLKAVQDWVLEASDGQIICSIVELQREKHEVENRYRTAEENCSHLERQIHELQEEMLSTRYRLHAVSDNTFKEKLDKVQSKVKNLSQRISKSASTSSETFAQALENRTLTASIEAGCWKMKKNRSSLIMSAIWQHLRQSLFSHMFQLYGEVGGKAHETWKLLVGEGISTGIRSFCSCIGC